MINALPNLQLHLQLPPNVTEITHPNAQIVSLTLDILAMLLSLEKKTEEYKVVLVIRSRCFEMIVRLALDFEQVVELTNKALFVLGLICFKFRPSQEILESATFQRPGDDTMEAAIVRLVRLVLFDNIESRRQIAFDCLKVCNGYILLTIVEIFVRKQGRTVIDFFHCQSTNVDLFQR